MKTKLLSTLLLGVGLLVPGLQAQPAATPTAPVTATAPDRTVFAPRLPTPAELTDIAAAQGLAIERIEQTATQVTVTTKSADGRLNTVLYQLLSSIGTVPAAAPVSVTTPAVVPVATPTTVVVTNEPEVIYVPSRRYYSYDPLWVPWNDFVPFAVGVGLGFTFHDHGGHYGHFRGHSGWRRR